MNGPVSVRFTNDNRRDSKIAVVPKIFWLCPAVGLRILESRQVNLSGVEVYANQSCFG